MTMPADKVLDALRASLKETDRLRQRNRQLAASSWAPIAIVGMGCRFPGGVNNPEELWDLVAAGGDAITAFPDDRGWEAVVSETETKYVQTGGFVQDAPQFDAGFFGISPREALAMDPQQRMLLEVTWETFEQAGIDPAGLRGSRTGVFAGGTNSGYGVSVAGIEGTEGYMLTGGLTAVISGRISYTLGLEGPAVTVDTACSSALVALHLACQSLRSQECSMALAGAVTVLANPDSFADFAEQGGLAADGRCKAFAGAADGIGWSEGAGMFLLERLSDARRNGHPVLAVIRGSAVSQDGASNGLSAPNGPAQRRVIRDALSNARLSPAEVDAVEAHGTGTVLGDPIEAQAILATYGRDRTPDRPLWLGSVKSNVGHTGAAAGAAGLIKMVQALRNRQLPRTLHVDEPTPRVDWTAGEVRLLTEPRPWNPEADDTTGKPRPRRAGISAFGISGTNAHVVIEEAPEEAAPTADNPVPTDNRAPTGSPVPAERLADAGGAGGEAGPETVEPQPKVLTGASAAWLVSARTAGGLAAQATRLAEFSARKPDLDPVDVGWSLATARSLFEHRAVVVGADRDALTASLAALATGAPAAGLVSGSIPAGGSAGRKVFVFPGQGGQWVGMGRELAGASPVFAARLAECGEALAPYVEWDLVEVLGDSGVLSRLDVVHPVLWAVMVSLAAVWEAAGVRPDAVIGHSQGEIAAACVAGVLSLSDGARVVARRGQAMMALAGRGGVLSIAASLEAVEARLRPGVSVATVNGPEAVTVSGAVDALSSLAAECERDGVRARFVPMDYAPHGPQVEGIRGEVLAALEGVVPGTAVIPMVSGMTGDYLDGSEAGPEYWYASLRSTVQFARGVERLGRDGYGVFVEVSPHPVLTTAMAATLETAEIVPVVTGTLRRDEGGPARVLASLAEVHVRGVPVDWTAVLPTGRRVDLPTYAFQRQRFWPSSLGGGVGDLRSAGLNSVGHSLLGAAVELADGDGLVLTGRLSVRAQPWLGDHLVGGTAYFPGTGYVELAVVAGHLVGCTRIDELTLADPLMLLPDEEMRIQVTVSGPDQDGLREVEIFARSADAGGEWTRHAAGRVGAAAPADANADDLSVWPPEDADPIPLDGLYEALAAAGQDLGPAFRGLNAVWRRGEDVFAEVALPEQNATNAAVFGLHPAVLDAALQAVWLTSSGDAGARMPFVWSDVSLYAAGATMLRVRLRQDVNGAVSLLAVDAAGTPVVSVGSLVLRPVEVSRSGAGHALRDALFSVEWVPVPVSAAPVGRWGVVGADSLGLATGLAEAGVELSIYPDLASLTAAAESGDLVPEVVLLGIESGESAHGDQAQAARRLTVEALEAAQHWLTPASLLDSRLVVVTRGAIAAQPGEGVTDLGAAAVWGLLRSAQSENPGRFVLVDLPARENTDKSAEKNDEANGKEGAEGSTAESAGAGAGAGEGADKTVPPLVSVGVLAGALGSAEPELAVRDQRAYGRRLVRPATVPWSTDPTGESPGASAAGEPGAADEVGAVGVGERVPGTVLITGGTGTLAGLTARHLATTGRARQLLLVSRSGPAAAGVAALAADLAEGGAGVRIAAADVADRAAVVGLLATLPRTHPLTGVVHAAGIVDDGVIGSLTPERVEAVMRPKTDPAWILHQLTEDYDLDLFVLFSSAAATFGGPGQGNYTAGNAFLDALAAHRRAAGLHGLSLAWGAWVTGAGIGRNLSHGLLARATGGGTAELGAEDGLLLLDLALSRDEALLVPFRLDVAGLRAAAVRGGALPPLLHGLAGPIRAGVTSAVNTGAGSGAMQRLARVPAAERDRILTQLVRSHVAAVLGHASPELIEPNRTFAELGFDSLTAVELRNRLSAATGLRLTATLVFDYPTAHALSGHLGEQLAGAGPASGLQAAPPLQAAVTGDPIAIVGMGCRFPGGVDSPDDMWRMLSTGTDTISRFPADRGWDTAALYDPDPENLGTSYTNEGGFVDGAGEFDPAFFRISPREAIAMDPQQRLLLETSWEALEHAGIDPTSLRGSMTGVFVGAAASGYSALGLTGDGAEGHLLTGNVPSVISGRVSYTLGLEGPAVTVDTACSSSLVALHLAAAALRTGECTMALAGGVMIMVDAAEFLSFAQQRALAADGRSKAFSDGADGMGLGEGSGMVVLERLSDARRNGHPVLAVVAGSAINQDGASNGLTAPNGPSQQRVIRAALAGAGLSAADVDAVEAHGTGTTLGDPIEAQALLATYGQDRPEGRPLWLGSVKSNIGHAQQAAGVAGVMKMVLALRNGELPATLHAAEPSSHIDWTMGDVRLLTEPVPWPAGGRPRRAGISSFGISGTNAHLIIQDPPAPVATPARTLDPLITHTPTTAWLVSAQTSAGLAAQAGRLVTRVSADPELTPADVGWSLATTRSTFEHRAVVLGGTRDDLLSGLSAVAAGHPAPGLVTGVAATPGPTVFVFPGQGSQWAGMGRDLARTSPVFAARLAECEQALSPYLDWSPSDVLAGTEGAPGLDRVDVVQPLLWAVMVSLAAVWQAAGVRPDAVVGHSQGEIAAAVIAGILTLDDAAKVVALRSQALTALSGRGGMLSIAEPAGLVETRLLSRTGQVAIAAVNGPDATVVSGDPEALRQVRDECERDGVRARMLPVDYASHGPQVDALREEILSLLDGISPRPATLPMVSAMTGEHLTGPEAGAEYWYASLRAPVRFERAIRALRAGGYGTFVEVSAHPVLTAAIGVTLESMADATGPAPVVAGTLRRDDGGPARMLASLAELHVRGVAVDWAGVLGGGARVDLPTYAFQHQRFWPLPPAAGSGDLRSAGLSSVGHALLGAAIELADGDGLVITGRLSARTQPWLGDHVLGGTAFFPGTGYVELAAVAGHLVGCTRIDELTLAAPLVLLPEEEVQVQVTVSGPDQDGLRDLEIFARVQDAGTGWTRHAAGRVGPSEPAADLDTADFAVWPPEGATPLGVDGLYEALAAAGQDFGPAFQGLNAAWRRGDDVFAEVALPDRTDTNAAIFGLHPAVLDAALQAVWLTSSGEGGPRMPFVWSDVSLYAAGATMLRARLRQDANGAVSLLAVDGAGAPVVSVGSLVLRPVAASAPGAGHSLRDALFGVEWVPVPSVGPAAAGRCAVVGADSLGLTQDLAAAGMAPASYPDLSALADSGDPIPEVLLIAVGTDGADQGRAARRLTNEVLALLQRWLTLDAMADSRLVVVTRGAVAARPGENVTDLAAAAVWGLLRSAQSENPGRLTLADLPANTYESPGDGGAPVSVLAGGLGSAEPELAVRDERLHGRRLTRPAASPGSAEPARTPGAVLITGGTGTLAGLTARHLAATGRARHLLLVSRSGPAAPGAAAVAAGVAEAGADVHVVAADVTDRAAVAGLLAGIPRSYALTGVVHTAGIVDDGVIGSLTPDQVDAVMRPKTDAAWILHELTEGFGLDLFVMFSSAAATFGSGGQGNYAAGNAFLDALAARRRAEGLPGLSLAWGAWVAGAGIGRNLSEGLLARATGGGTAELGADEGLAVFDLALSRDEALLVPFRLDVAGLRAVAARGGALPPLLHGLAGPIRAGVASAVNAGAGSSALRQQLARVPVPERDRLLIQLVRTHVAAVLGHASPELIEPGRAFSDLGFDSLTAVDLRNRLNEATGLRLPATLVFDYPTTAVLAGHLAAELLGVLVQDTSVPAISAPVTGEPIAIVAMGCRFPGGIHDPEGLWELLSAGKDAISHLPGDRGWNLEALYDPDPDKAGTSYARSGGFVHDAAEFDPGFFGISPREAQAMDPQQRLLLEVCWEALERAGIDPTSLRGSPTGVFAGGSSWGYGASGGGGSEGHLMTGASTSVISGRVSYTLGLEGPAVTVDTACSSALVAMHLAASALRAGECSLALAGGVTIMATPGALVGFSRQRGLAEDGRCKAFSASADGMGMAEGAGMILLERLSDARRNGHPVLAVMRGSAVNQDGASNGLTAPNGPSQQRVIRAALANAKLAAGDIDVVEAHGTGTTLGDPIEAQALLATYGHDRPEDRPLWLGSVKSNLGHTQSAAGAAGVMKMVLALHHQELPLSLHADEPAENIDWSAGDVRLLAEARPWPAGDRVRRAGVSSFGISGTNAHLIIEEAAPPEENPEPAEPPVLSDGAAWLVSGRTAAGLAEQAARLAEFAGTDETAKAAGVADIGWSLATTRSMFEHRAVIVGRSREELLAGLTAVATGRPSAQAVTGTVPAGGGGGRVVFVFPGQGSQWAGMGRELAASSPVFAARLAECGQALAPYVDWSLDDVLHGREGAPDLDRVDVVQPALWAIMVSLAAVWQAAGVHPDAVLGHSQGEIAAAYVAGILSLEDAARIVALRSRALTALSGRGGMLSLAESAEAVEARLVSRADRVDIAAVNGPDATVVSGDPDALDELAAECEAAGIRARRLPVDYASHGPQVEELRDEILTLLEPITPRPGRIPMASAMTGEILEGTEADAGYWYASLRAPVQFAETVQMLGDAGYTVFVETSAHPVLTTAVQATLDDPGPDQPSGTGGGDRVVTGTLRRDDGGPDRVLAALAEAHAHGVVVDWPKVLPAARRIALPTYAFQHERYWYRPALPGAGDVSSAGLDPVGHPLLGAAVELADAHGLVVTGRLSLAEQPWLAEPAAAATVLTELAVVAGYQVGCPRIAELTPAEPLVIEPGAPLQVQVVLGDPDDDGRRTVEIYARRARSDELWTRYAEGRLDQDRPADASLSGAYTIWPPTGATPLVSADAASDGPLRSAWRDGDDILAELALPDEASGAATYGLHPALLAALPDVVAVAGDGWPAADPAEILLPSGWTGMTLHAAGASTLRARLSRPADARPGDGRLSLVAVDATGAPVLSVESLTLRPVPAERLRTGTGRTRDAMFGVDWVPVPVTDAAPAGRWAVVGDDRLGLTGALTAAGVDAEAHTDLATLVETGEPAPDVVLACIGDTPADDEDTAQAARRTTVEALELIQRWLALDALDEARLVIVSRGAVATRPGDVVTDLPAAAAWGLVRSAQSEHPGRLILADLPSSRTVAELADSAGTAERAAPADSAESAETAEAIGVLAAALGSGEPELAIRTGRAHARRLTRRTATPAPAQPGDRVGTVAAAMPGDAAGTVLVTGGTGTLAGLVARHLVVTGRAGRLLLVSRSGPVAAGAAALAAGLAGSGAGVRIVACDVVDPGALAGLLAGTPLTGVVHTAGVLDDGVIDSLTAERVDAVMRPKVDAAWHLHRLTAELDLDFFALFSSAAATFGAAGQGNYAAGNAFLDALAAHRRAAGLPAVSLAWGLWADASGLTSHLSAGDRDRMTRGGVGAMSADEGLALLDLALTLDDALLVPARLNVAALRAQVAQAGTNALVPALLRTLSGGSNRALAAGGTAGEALRAQLAALSPAEADRTLTDLIRAHAGAVLGHGPTGVMETGRAFRDVGFDSLTAVELRNRLAAVTGLKLPVTLIFDYPTPAALAAHLRAELQQQARPGQRQGARPELPAVAAAAPDEAIAIVGIGCRFPGGADNPEHFWELLRTGTDAIAGFPTDRGWDTDAVYAADAGGGASTTRLGGFLYDAGEFDPGFFGISPREAIAMDPQQRLLLETSWEALERAGIDPVTLRGSATGVFAGGYGGSWYGIGQEGYGTTGSAGSVISGRVSYALGLEGPAVTVDTACSSSLVAIHLAAQALRSGECTLALAGGATVMATPGLFTEFSRQGGLATDGRCKSFSASADGTGWGEGAGIILLERVSDARRNGHRILAVIRGSAVNQDGASNGLTAPNGPSQQRVIRAALANARLRAGDVDAVEAHGTGTVLGDPIEAQALLATYGQDRPEGRPVWLGSVKSNIAHTGAAAGVAGVIKMVLALENEVLPRTLHADEASPHVDWSMGEARLLTEPTAWPVGERPRRAGVSAFGISGTNAHLIIEEAPDASARHDAVAVPDGGASAPQVLRDAPLAWLLSARTVDALAGQARRLAGRARDGAGVDPVDVAWSLATTRSVFEHRAVVLGADPAELLSGSMALAAGERAGNVLSGAVPADRTGRVGFLFAGQGAQRAGMGRELYAASPVFAAAFDRVVEVLEAELGLAIRDVVLSAPDVRDLNGVSPGGDALNAVRADQTLYAQTGLFAVEVGLVALLAAAGIVPDVVAGHSVGEIAAAYAAGVLTLEGACALVARRARLMQGLPLGGAMAAIAASEAEVAAELESVPGVSLAAVNGPASVVVSGDEAAVDRLVEVWRERGRRVRRLRVSHAFHSARMDPVLTELDEVAAGLEHRMPAVPWVGALSGELIAAPETGYWAAQARRPVRFADAVTTMAAQGVSTFIEIGPDGTLSAMGSTALTLPGTDDTDFLPMLRPDTPASTSVMTALGRAHARGVEVDWTAVLPTGRRIDLPTYAFSRKRFWAEAPAIPAGSGTAAEAQFWAAVEQGDLAGLAGALDVDAQRPFSEVLPVLASWRQRDRVTSAAGDWRHGITWVPISDPEPVALTGTWLLVTGPTGLGLAADCVRMLADRGATAIQVEVGACDADRETLGARLSEVRSAHTADGPAPSISGVLSLLALEEASLPGFASVPAGLAATQGLIQVLGDAGVTAPLWVVTRSAVAVAPGESLTSPVQAQVWGLGRVAALEHPDRWGGLIDVPQESTDRVASRLGAVLAGCGEDQVAIRGAGIMARRLVRGPRPGGGRSWAPRGAVLVTGGTGALGGRVARWLPGRGASRVVLSSRSGPAAAGAAALAATLAAAGTRAEVVACDTAERAEVAGLLAWIGSGGAPLSTVFHAAGTERGGPLQAGGPEELAANLAPKASGAEHLDELTAGLDLDAFVLFSSIAAVWGSGHQSAYAAANAYLDALAENRRARGLTATSVAWGLWGGGGMGARDGGEAAAQMARMGIRAMDPDQAIGALAATLDGGEGLVTVADIDWERFVPVFTLRRPSPLISDLPEARQVLHAGAADGEVTEAARSPLGERLAAVSPAERDRILTDLVRAEVAAVLGHESPDSVGARQAFQDLGFDSLTAVELRNRLSTATAMRLPATLIFDYPTPTALARHLQSELVPSAGDSGTENAEEAELRKVLSSVPLSLLRSAGLLEPLLELADVADGAPEPDEESVSIEEMDVADLIRIARDRSSSEELL
ncbi:type I polyketide synthase [Nonomuraea sp. ZG12]|uniref:type I polyketide synthase n=1 Tax=Nonomuraea sp. ZG12 TaxID=3452207 RepID=UPI003F8C1437